MIYSVTVNCDDKTNLVVLSRVKFLVGIVGVNGFNGGTFGRSFFPRI
jgi:hypothetical protein